VSPPGPDESESDARTRQEQDRELMPIAGIGASAGAVAALRRLLQNMPRDCGMALVIVQHLDPDRESALAEILGRSSTLPITQVQDGSVVEADHVYVISPNQSLTLQNGVLALAPLTGSRKHPNVIDEFFTSLAHDRGDRAACVILSGTGSDGTLGLRAIKEHGGLTVAQADAEYDGMMRSAVATGLVDFVLRP
jgi:two-component system, chemotaxis family, CheB/CheR fusion protein